VLSNSKGIQTECLEVVTLRKHYFTNPYIRYGFIATSVTLQPDRLTCTFLFASLAASIMLAMRFVASWQLASPALQADTTNH